MIGITETSAALGGIKAAIDIARGVQSLKSETEINQAIIDIQRVLLDAQSAALRDHEKHMELLNRIRDLELEKGAREEWEQEKSRYILTEFPTGRLAYVVKEERRQNEPSHRLCVKCFNEGRKSVLQTKHKHSGGESVICPTCKESSTLHEFPPAEIKSVGRRGTWLEGY